tara:strand:- start:993 stop:1142 length:150 start_codon:yes stop_codon:yes gene_type:complete
MLVFAFNFDTNLDVEFGTMIEAIVFFSVAYGYPIGMVLMAWISHNRHKQ